MSLTYVVDFQEGTMTRHRDNTNPIIIASNTVAAIISTCKSIVANIPKVHLFVYAVFGLVVIVVVIVLILALFFYVRPVIPGVCHSSNFDEYMTNDYYPDFIATLRVFAQDVRQYAAYTLTGETGRILSRPTSRFSRALSSFNDIATSAATSALALVAFDDITLTKNLKTYFSHFRCFASRSVLPYSFFCSSSLSSNPDFCSIGTGRKLDMIKVTVFETSFVVHIENLRNATKSISMSANATQNITSNSWYVANPKKAFDWVMSAHKLRMYLNEYHAQINESAMSRSTDKWGINTWIIYYVPFVSDILRFRIPEIWRTLPSKAQSLNNVWNKAWVNLGNEIAKIPCKMVFTGDKRTKYCGGKLFDMPATPGTAIKASRTVPAPRDLKMTEYESSVYLVTAPIT